MSARPDLSRENPPAAIAGGEAVVHFTFDGKELSAASGTSVAAALWADGQRALRMTTRGEPRGVFCGMGVCGECRVTIDGLANLRSCNVYCREGMEVRTDG